MGSHVCHFQMQRLQPTSRSTVVSQTHAAVFGTLDGAVGAIVPLEEGVYQRLRFLQREMCRKLDHNAGLNPVQFRVPKSKQEPLRYERRQAAQCIMDQKFKARRPDDDDSREGSGTSCVLDGVLLWQYINLDTARQMELARTIGTTPRTILQNLFDLDLTTKFY